MKQVATTNSPVKVPSPEATPPPVTGIGGIHRSPELGTAIRRAQSEEIKRRDLEREREMARRKVMQGD